MSSTQVGYNLSKFDSIQALTKFYLALKGSEDLVRKAINQWAKVGSKLGEKEPSGS